MSAPPGVTRLTSTTARPADKGAERRLVSALVALSGNTLRRSDARAIVNQRLGLGETPDEVEAYLRTTFRIDPTGVTAVRNVDRARRHR